MLKVEDQLHKRGGEGIQVGNDKESGSPFPGYTLSYAWKIVISLEF